MPPFKDEHVLIIAPGSVTTEAQLGLPESFTPPRWRFPTRMFPSLTPGEWEPVKIRNKTTTIQKSIDQSVPAAVDGGTPAIVDVEMNDVAQTIAPEAPQAVVDEEINETTDETVEVSEDDPFEAEGAVYPIQAGRVEDWPCFFALMSHIYNTISPPFHTPVLVVTQPCWSSRDHELLTTYFFENWKIPALCLMDAALTACYAYGVSTALVVDVGHEKCDVTAVTEFVVNDIGRGARIEGCGGRAMTLRLQETLRERDFDEQMAEQLKKSPICEILPVGTPYPKGSIVPNGEVINPAAAASTGALDSGPAARDADGLRPGQAPRGDEATAGDDDDNEGVLDVAAIVAKDNAAELLAKREKEKAERAAAKKGGAAELSRALRLRNAEKERATFTYHEFLSNDSSQNGDAPALSRKRKRDIEIGVERFMAATPSSRSTDGILDMIASAVHTTVLGVPDIPQRSTLWENVIVLGNGSRVKGFTASLLSTITSKYTLSPSTATIFTSELPSNFTTPVATPGTNTPIPGQGGHPMHHPAGHGVNPLLVAAAKNMMQSNQHLQVPGQQPPPSMADPNMHQSHRGFGQTPTAVKTVKPPDYFPEWKDPSVSGMEEAAFLGAQVAAKVVFIVDMGLSKGFLTRTEYNDLGPGGIHECAL